MTRLKDVIYILKNTKFWIGVCVITITILAVMGCYNFVYANNQDTVTAEAYERQRVREHSRAALLDDKRNISNIIRNYTSIYEDYLLDEHIAMLEDVKQLLRDATTEEELAVIENKLIELENLFIERVQEVQAEEEARQNAAPQGNGILTPSAGRIWFNGHQETYYNLDMSGVISNARALGITGEYWVNGNGCKMLGNYIMVASSDFTKGTVISTSLGAGIVVDYCPTPGVVDVATVW